MVLASNLSERGRRIIEVSPIFINITCLSEYHPTIIITNSPSKLFGGAILVTLILQNARRTRACLSLVVSKVHRLIDPGYIYSPLTLERLSVPVVYLPCNRSETKKLFFLSSTWL